MRAAVPSISTQRMINWLNICREREGLTMINSVLPRFSKRQGVISKDREGVTKKGQGAAPCKNGLGRTLINDL